MFSLEFVKEKKMDTNINSTNEVEQKKDTELNYVGSVSDDGFKTDIPSSEIISQDDMNIQLDDDWLLKDKVELFDAKHESFKALEALNPMQIALQKALDKERGMIPDNVTLPCSIDKGDFYYTSSSNTPVVKMRLSVNDGTSNPKYVEDFFFFGDDYVDNTIERLNTVLSRFNYHLTNEDVKDYSSIAEAINRLHGRSAKIKQYEKNNDKKYWYYRA